MTTQKKVQRAAEQNNSFLSKRAGEHIRLVENSLNKLQGHIIDSVNELSTSDGKLDGLKVNLAQMNRIHRDIVNYFEDDFSRPMQIKISEMRDIEKIISKSYAGLGISADFSGVDKGVLKTLMEGNYRSYLSLGGQYQEKVIQQVYNQVIGNGSFSELVYGIQGALLGTNAKGVKGVPLANYSKLYARDMLFNFHQEANLMKAREAELNHFLYVGNIIETSREFCIERVGQYFTLEEINSWTFDWPGKSGPAMTYRGGWNCRHHWQAIRPEWVNIEKGERLDIGDWNLEQDQKPLVVFSEKMQDSFSRLNQEWKTTAQEMKDNYNIKVQDAHDNPELSPYLTEEEVKQQVKTIKELQKEVQRMEKDFPKLGEFLKSNGEETNLYLSNSQYITRVQNQNLNQGVLGCQIKNNIYIATQQEIGVERINLIKDMAENWPEDAPLPFTVSSGLKATFRHELAHRYSATYLQGGQYYSSDSPLKDSFGGLLDGNRFEKLWRLHMMAENPGKSLLFVSRYGRTNEHEYFAEAFTAFTSPGYKPGMLSSSLETSLRNLVGSD